MHSFCDPIQSTIAHPTRRLSKRGEYMKLKKITENGTEYFVIEDDEKVTENSEKTQKRDTGCLI